MTKEERREYNKSYKLANKQKEKEYYLSEIKEHGCMFPEHNYNASIYPFCPKK